MSSSDNSKVFHPEVESVEEFVQRFKLQNADKLEEAEDNPSRRAMLLANALPIDVLTDIQRRLKPKKLVEATYEELEKHLTSSYTVKKSQVGAAVSFVNRKQKSDESIESYSKVLNELASKCGYNDCCRDRLLRDVFVSGLKSSRIIGSLISECEDKKFNECVERAKTLDQVTKDVDDINPTARVNAAYKTNEKGNSNNKYKNNRSSRDNNHRNAKKKIPSSYVCIRCGSKAKHYANECYAINTKCLKCSKVGHLSRVCKSKVSQNSNHIDSENSDLAPEEYDSSHYINIQTIRPIYSGRRSSNETNNEFSVAVLDRDFPPLPDRSRSRDYAAAASPGRGAAGGVLKLRNKFERLAVEETTAQKTKKENRGRLRKETGNAPASGSKCINSTVKSNKRNSFLGQKSKSLTSLLMP